MGHGIDVGPPILNTEIEQDKTMPSEVPNEGFQQEKGGSVTEVVESTVTSSQYMVSVNDVPIDATVSMEATPKITATNDAHVSDVATTEDVKDATVVTAAESNNDTIQEAKEIEGKKIKSEHVSTKERKISERSKENLTDKQL